MESQKHVHMQTVQTCTVRCQEGRRSLTSDDVKEAMVQHSVAAALLSLEGLLEWRQLTPQYRNILDGGEAPPAGKKKTGAAPKK